MPGGSSQRRPGFPLSAKLILTTSLLLAAAVGASAYASLKTIHDFAEREVASRRAAGEKAVERETRLLAHNAASSAALPLADGNFTYLDSLVEQTIREDPRIEWMLISDGATQRVVARSAAAPLAKQKALDDSLNDAVKNAPAGEVPGLRDAKDPTRFTFGMRIQVGDRVVGQLRLGVSTAELENELSAAIAHAWAQGRRAARDIAIVAGLILLIGVFLSALQGLRMVRPLHALSEQATRIADGDLEVRVDVRTRDEIGILAQDFNVMADRLGALIAQTAEKASLEREMSLARLVQESMIPPRRLLEHGPFRLIGHCEPATACGGDWWTVRPLSDRQLLVVVGDVTGHGIPSAMVAATARGAVEAVVSASAETGRLVGAAEVLRAIHGALRGVGTHELLMTCFAAVVDADRGTVEFSNAGHNFPYVLRIDKQQKVSEMAVLALRGSPLGNIPGDFILESGRRQLSPGDVIVFYTDGVIDRVDNEGNRFGDRRLRGLLRAREVGARGAGLPALKDDILRSMSVFSGGEPADDDVTLVLCQFDPPAEDAALRRAFA